MTATAHARRERLWRLPEALRVAVALVAAVTMIAVGLAGLFASAASAGPLTGPGNAVGVFGAAGGQVVGAHQPVLAGQCRARAPSYDPAASGSCVAAEQGGGLEDLAARRAALGAEPAGPGVSPTLSRLDVEGMDPLNGTSGHGRPVSLTVNPISATHAETDVLQQLADLGGAEGREATLYVDYPGGLCGACGRSGAVRSMARQVGISRLTVVWPGGSTVIEP